MVGALAICAAAAFVRITRDTPLDLTRPFRLWTAGAMLFAVAVALQLIPLPNPILGVLSPELALDTPDHERIKPFWRSAWTSFCIGEFAMPHRLAKVKDRGLVAWAEPAVPWRRGRI